MKLRYIYISSFNFHCNTSLLYGYYAIYYTYNYLYVKLKSLNGKNIDIINK